MKKMMVLAATLALVLGVSVPAMAQSLLEAGNEAESGGVGTAFEVANEGDYASQCVPALQFGNSGNFNNTTAFLQDRSISDDFEPGGLEFAIEPEVEVACESTVQQSSAASGK